MGFAWPGIPGLVEPTLLLPGLQQFLRFVPGPELPVEHGTPVSYFAKVLLLPNVGEF